MTANYNIVYTTEVEQHRDMLYYITSLTELIIDEIVKLNQQSNISQINAVDAAARIAIYFQKITKNLRADKSEWLYFFSFNTLMGKAKLLIRELMEGDSEPNREVFPERLEDQMREYMSSLERYLVNEDNSKAVDEGFQNLGGQWIRKN